MSSNTTIQTGAWYNHSTKTLTLTLDRIPAGLLSTAIVIFIGQVATQLWKFVRFIFHQSKAARAERECLHHQKQALLRNSGSADSLIPQLIVLSWSWRKAKKHGGWKALRGLSLVLFVAILYFFAFEGAKLASSLIESKSGDGEVRIKSPNCGFSVFVNNTDNQLNNDYRLLVLNQTIAAETYTKQCYVPNPDPFQCGYFPQRQLKWISRNTSCPLASNGLCTSLDSAPYQMDSGYIDSDVDLGINAKPSDRIKLRKLTTCSPFHGSPFLQTVNATDTDLSVDWPSGTQLHEWHLGTVGGSGGSSITFSYATFAPLFGFPYELTPLSYNPGSFLQYYSPNDTFSNREDADLTVLFLAANSVLNIYPTDDPLYYTPSTNNKSRETNSGNTTVYLPQYDISLLACYDQHQFCNPSRTGSNNCTELLPYGLLALAINDLGFNKNQLSTAQRLNLNLPMTTIFNAVEGRGAAALLASQSVFELQQILPLPINQWQIEVGNLFSVSLAKLQQTTIDFATGPSEPQLLQYQHYPSDPETRSQCLNQKVNNRSDKRNFNLEAIIIVSVIGTILILLGNLGDTLVEFFYNIGHKDEEYEKTYRHRQWIIDAVLQLQRLAYSSGLAPVLKWERKDESTPVSLKCPFPYIEDIDPEDPSELGAEQDTGSQERGHADADEDPQRREGRNVIAVAGHAQAQNHHVNGGLVNGEVSKPAEEREEPNGHALEATREDSELSSHTDNRASVESNGQVFNPVAEDPMSSNQHANDVAREHLEAQSSNSGIDDSQSQAHHPGGTAGSMGVQERTPTP